MPPTRPRADRTLAHLFAAMLAVSVAHAASAADAPPPAAPPSAPPATAAPSGPAPLSVDDLFGPIAYRSYELNPSGTLLLERYPSFPGALPEDFDLRDPEHRRLARMSEEVVLVTDLETLRYTRIEHSTRGFRTADPIWYDDTHFVWSVVAGLGDDKQYYAERITLAPLDGGGYEFTDTTRLARFGVTLGAVPKSTRVLFLDADESGVRLHRIDPREPVAAQLVAENLAFDGIDDFDRVALDDQGVVRAFSARRRSDQERVYFRDAPDAPWRMVHAFTMAADSIAYLDAYDAASGKLLVITNEGSDRAVLRELDPRDGKLGRIRYQDPHNDLAATIRDPRDHRLLAVRIDDAVQRMEPVDPQVRALFAKVEAKLAGRNPSLVSVDAGVTRAIVFTSRPEDPGQYTYYDARTDSLRLIAHAAPRLQGRRLAATRSTTIKARDGLKIGVYFTAPLAPVATPPLVVMPHGGPLGIRERLAYDPEVQWLASRGYGVLQVDFRGSGGYGSDFLRRGYKQWGREMLDDIDDALRHALAQGWGDPARVCIYGSSYGGYAAMMSLFRHAERYRCGVTMAGVSDLGLLFKSEEVRSTPGLRDLIAESVGDPEHDRELLNQLSPAFLARNGMPRPVFIAHGGKDARAEPEHAYRLRAAIEGAGGKVEWMFAPEAGHGFSKLKDQREFYGRLVAFLDAQLGR